MVIILITLSILIHIHSSCKRENFLDESNLQWLYHTVQRIAGHH